MNLNLVEERGRVFIPADVSTQLAWSPGMRLVVKQAENGQMWLQPESPIYFQISTASAGPSCNIRS